MRKVEISLDLDLYGRVYGRDVVAPVSCHVCRQLTQGDDGDDDDAFRCFVKMSRRPEEARGREYQYTFYLIKLPHNEVPVTHQSLPRFEVPPLAARCVEYIGTSQQTSRVPKCDRNLTASSSSSLSSSSSSARLAGWLTVPVPCLVGRRWPYQRADLAPSQRSAVVNPWILCLSLCLVCLSVCVVFGAWRLPAPRPPAHRAPDTSLSHTPDFELLNSLSWSPLPSSPTFSTMKST